MNDIEFNNDSWSLFAIVRESARKARLRDLAPPESPKSTTTTTTTIEPTIDNSWNTYTNHSSDNFYSESPFSDYSFDPIYPTEFNDFSPLDEMINMYKPFLTPHSADQASSSTSTNPAPAAVFPAVVSEPVVVSAELTPQQNVLHEQLKYLDFSQFQQKKVHKRSSLKRNNKPQESTCFIGHQDFIQTKKINRYDDRTVCYMTLEELQSKDKWAWRKYGQKPIKGSPYPRNYYRCSSSKGCTARKQVERSPGKPDNYVVTYTGHHQHPRPPPRNTGGPKPKLFSANPSDPQSSSEKGSPTPPPPVLNTASEPNGSGSGSGSEQRLGKAPMEITEDEEFHDYEELAVIPNPMADTDLLMGMEQLVMSKSKSKSKSKGKGKGKEKRVKKERKIDQYEIKEIRPECHCAHSSKAKWAESWDPINGYGWYSNNIGGGA